MRLRIRILLAFAAGVVVAALVIGIAGMAGSVAASTRYEDLGLFTSVLNLVRRNYV